MITYSDVGGLSYVRLQQNYPDRIHRIHIDFQEGIDFVKLSRIAETLGIEAAHKIAFLVKNLYECFVQRDCL